MGFVGGTTISLFFAFTWEDILRWQNLVVYAVLIFVTVLVFFLNMWSTHRLLSRTKQLHLANAVQMIAGAYEDLTTLTDRNESMSTAEAKINAWATMEKRLKSTRTWPYDTEILRTLFITALTPIAVGLSKLIAALIASGRA